MDRMAPRVLGITGYPSLPDRKDNFPAGLTPGRGLAEDKAA